MKDAPPAKLSFGEKGPPVTTPAGNRMLGLAQHTLVGQFGKVHAVSDEFSNQGGGVWVGGPLGRWTTC